jgi:hypothetical protein
LGFLGFAAWVSVHGVVVVDDFFGFFHRMVVGFSGFCRLGFGAQRGGG